jgi:hypothetical protein
MPILPGERRESFWSSTLVDAVAMLIPQRANEKLLERQRTHYTK